MNELRWRWQRHKGCYGEWLNGKEDQKLTIYPYFKQYGIEKFKMILVKEYDVVDKKHLLAYEALWMSKFKKSVVNKNCPFRVKGIYDQNYRLLNKDLLCEKSRKYYEDNKEIIHSRAKAHREKNKEKLQKQKAEKMTCECGGKWTKGHGFRIHERTKKHQRWSAEQQQQITTT